MTSDKRDAPRAGCAPIDARAGRGHLLF